MHRDYYNLVLCYVMLPYFLRKISGYIENLWAKSYDLLCSLLCSVMLAYDFFMKVSKILCPVMLCLWWHELKSKILWYVMLVLFVSKILCSVMNLTVCYYVLDFCQDQLGKRVWKVLLYDDVVCFLVVLDLIFETLAHIWATLRSLLKELACLTVFSTVKRASSFNRDLRVPMTFTQYALVYVAKTVWS